MNIAFTYKDKCRNILPRTWLNWVDILLFDEDVVHVPAINIVGALRIGDLLPRRERVQAVQGDPRLQPGLFSQPFFGL